MGVCMGILGSCYAIVWWLKCETKRLLEIDLPGSSTKQCCISSKNKAVLVALTIGKDHVTKLLHHTRSTHVHQLQGTAVIGLLKAMLI